jgi:hypothetical protein
MLLLVSRKTISKEKCHCLPAARPSEAEKGHFRAGNDFRDMFLPCPELRNGKTGVENGPVGWIRPLLRADAARHFPLDSLTGPTQYRAKVMSGSGCDNPELSCESLTLRSRLKC